MVIDTFKVNRNILTFLFLFVYYFYSLRDMKWIPYYPETHRNIGTGINIPVNVIVFVDAVELLLHWSKLCLRWYRAAASTLVNSSVNQNDVYNDLEEKVM